MDLRVIKKEVEALPNLEKSMREFQNSWLKPIRKNTNQHLPFLKDLDNETKNQLTNKLLGLNESISLIKNSQVINEKLKHYSRYLIELKLTTFNNNQEKSKVITNQFLNDEFLNIKRTIHEVKHFDNHVQNLQEQYHEINDLLHKQLSLEETVFFMNLPHLKYLSTLVKTADKHKTITRHIGRHLVALTKQTQLKNHKK
jgi:hypothetical protein